MGEGVPLCDIPSGCCFQGVPPPWGFNHSKDALPGVAQGLVLGCLPLVVPIGLSPLLILTLCGSERVLVVGGGGYPRTGGQAGGAGVGARKGHPGAPTDRGGEQHRHTERRSHTRRDKAEHSRQGGGAQQGRRGNQNSGNREPERRGWESVRMGGSDNKGDGLASQPRRYRVPGQPLLNRHQVGGVSRSPDGLFAQLEREPIRGRPAVRGKRTYGGRPGQRVEEQGTKHSEAGYGRPVDRGAWTAKTVK